MPGRNAGFTPAQPCPHPSPSATRRRSVKPTTARSPVLSVSLGQGDGGERGGRVAEGAAEVGGHVAALVHPASGAPGAALQHDHARALGVGVGQHRAHGLAVVPDVGEGGVGQLGAAHGAGHGQTRAGGEIQVGVVHAEAQVEARGVVVAALARHVGAGQGRIQALHAPGRGRGFVAGAEAADPQGLRRRRGGMQRARQGQQRQPAARAASASLRGPEIGGIRQGMAQARPAGGNVRAVLKDVAAMRAGRRGLSGCHDPMVTRYLRRQDGAPRIMGHPSTAHPPRRRSCAG